MRDYKSLLKPTIFILFLIIVFGYAIFEARGIIRGPIIENLKPENGSSFAENLIEISGRTKNVAFLKLNDHPISMDENRFFQEKYLLSPGYNIIKLEAKDRMGRKKILYLEYLYNSN